MELSKNNIIKAKNANNAILFNNVFLPDYTWNDFINHLDYAYGEPNNNSGIYDAKEVIGLVNFWHKLTYTVEGVSNKTFPEIEEKFNFLKTLHPSDGHGYFAAMSLTTKDPTTGKHHDPVDVMYCQFIGSVIWKIEYPETVEHFILNPGDMIYVPSGIMHEVTSLTPRAAISFMFGA